MFPFSHISQLLGVSFRGPPCGGVPQSLAVPINCYCINSIMPLPDQPVQYSCLSL